MKIVAKTLLASVAAYDSYSSYAGYASEDGVTCGGTITGESTIVSPLSGDFYYNNLNCIWNIELPASVIYFDLVARKFAVERDTTCSYDRLQIIYHGNEVNYCGAVDPATLRRKREAEESPKKKLSPRSFVVNPISSGFKSTTILGNTATVSFFSDAGMSLKGFEIDITNIVHGEEPAAPTPADAWAQIEAAAADVATRVEEFYTALPGLGPNSILASKKVARFNAFFNKMDAIYALSSADSCADYPAGSNDHAAFLAPVDSEDACEELQGLFASLISFTDSFVCMPSADYKPAKLNAFIHRQRRQIVTRKLKQMKCGNN